MRYSENKKRNALLDAEAELLDRCPTWDPYHNLAAARLRHIAVTAWLSERHLNMKAASRQVITA